MSNHLHIPRLPHLTYLLSTASILACVTFIPIYSRELGFNNAFITLLVASYSTAVFIGSAIGGRASDRFNRKIIIVIGLITSSFTFTGIFFAYDQTSLLLIRISAGISAGLAPPALIAYAYEQRYKMGSFSSFGSLGWGVGTIIAGWVAIFQTNFVFLTSGLFFFCSFLCALFLVEDTTNLKFVRQTEKELRISSSRIFLKNFSIYLPMFLRHSAAMAVWTLWPLFLVDTLGFDTIQIGMVQAANALTQFVWMGIFVDRMKSDYSFELGLLMSAGTFITFLLTSEFWLFLITQIFLGASWANQYVGAVKLVTERNPTYRGTASGFLTATISIAGLAGPIYTFLLLGIFSEPDIYYILILFAALMAFTAFIIHIVFRFMVQKTPTPQ